jgi:hypothetical protein
MVRSYLFAAVHKQVPQAHRHKAQYEHRWQPECEIH